jgi:murein L,D-transpeptidase YcbB/YkuD
MFHRYIFVCLSALVLLSSISGCKGRRHRLRPNPAIYTKSNYTDYFVDSVYVAAELERDTMLKPFADDITDFYQRRGYQAAWLSEGKLTTSAYEFINTLRSYRNDFGDSSFTQGLEDRDLGAMLLSQEYDKRSALDLKLTGTFFRYADRAYGGKDVDLKDLEWYIPRMKKDYQKLLDSLVSSPKTYSAYEPVNGFYKALKTVLIHYRDIKNKGGLTFVASPKLPLRKGDSTDAVVLLKKALTATGDYTGPDLSAAYTDPLAAAVSHYQVRLGLRPTGILDSLTLAEINIPIDLRIEQIMLNMERLRWLPDTVPAHFILVNIPEYRLHIYEHSQLQWSMNVVVGNAATATSIFTGRLSVVDFCPYWNVPNSIIKKELLPHLKKDPDYLDKMNMEIVNGDQILSPDEINWNRYKDAVPFVIRQRSGPQNSLGRIAFFFPNSFDIYLHDTPAQSFFSESSRAFSHGCIRLAEPLKLADYVFKNNPQMDSARIRELIAANQEKKVPVYPSIPVYIVYFTAWVDEAGQINFRHDVYGHDAKLAKEVFGR